MVDNDKIKENMTIWPDDIAVKFLIKKRAFLLWPTDDFKAYTADIKKEEKRENKASQESSMRISRSHSVGPLMKNSSQWGKKWLSPIVYTVKCSSDFTRMAHRDR